MEEDIYFGKMKNLTGCNKNKLNKKKNQTDIKYIIGICLLLIFTNCNTQKDKKMKLNNIQPMIVPSSYIKTGFDLPNIRIKNKEFLICWVRNYESSNSYILREEYEKLNKENPNWKRKATENLRESEYFHKFNQRNEKGKLLWISFMNDLDAVSSSKILLSPELERIFPEGYWVGTPNRVVGFAISKKCNERELKEVKEFVNKMYDMHGSPHSREIYEADEFLLPKVIVKPIDKELSDSLIEFVLKGEENSGKDQEEK